jgi:hypothetical protein
VGDTFRQEYAKGVAEDKATVLSIHEAKSVPAGTFRDVVETKDFSPLEPGVVEHKFFAPGVGFASSVVTKGGEEVLRLARVVKS